MCQTNETRCFKTTKPKTVYKIVDTTHPELAALYRFHTYAPLGELDEPTDIRSKGEDAQYGYHCFLSLNDVRSVYYGGRIDNGGYYKIVRCIIPVNEEYRYGTFFAGQDLYVRTLRASNIIIEDII